MSNIDPEVRKLLVEAVQALLLCGTATTHHTEELPPEFGSLDMETKYKHFNTPTPDAIEANKVASKIAKFLGGKINWGCIPESARPKED